MATGKASSICDIPKQATENRTRNKYLKSFLDSWIPVVRLPDLFTWMCEIIQSGWNSDKHELRQIDDHTKNFWSDTAQVGCWFLKTWTAFLKIGEGVTVKGRRRGGSWIKCIHRALGIKSQAFIPQTRIRCAQSSGARQGHQKKKKKIQRLGWESL